jgi:prepilin-type N-terminal cleavage/methylation domain-containing protein
MKTPSVRRGFTLIELLVVIAIIAILVGILLPVLATVRRTAKESATRAFMKSIETACAAYEFDWGFYPPDGMNPVVVAKKPAAGTYNAQNSQTLYYFLCAPFRILPNATKNEVAANKDVGPYLDVPDKHQKVIATGGPVEIVDVWKHPLQYDNIRDPAPLNNNPNGFDDHGTSEIRTSATLINNSGAVGRNVQGLDLWSMGDGGDGTTTQCTRPLANFKCKWE